MAETKKTFPSACRQHGSRSRWWKRCVASSRQLEKKRLTNYLKNHCSTDRTPFCFHGSRHAGSHTLYHRATPTAPHASIKERHDVISHKRHDILQRNGIFQQWLARKIRLIRAKPVDHRVHIIPISRKTGISSKRTLHSITRDDWI